MLISFYFVNYKPRVEKQAFIFGYQKQRRVYYDACKNLNKCSGNSGSILTYEVRREEHNRGIYKISDIFFEISFERKFFSYGKKLNWSYRKLRDNGSYTCSDSVQKRNKKEIEEEIYDGSAYYRYRIGFLSFCREQILSSRYRRDSY